MKKVLVCDDAAFMRASIKMMLERNGYAVLGEAVNGVMALEKFQELQPDIVTMDITMPDMDGIEAVKAIKAINPSAKILMVSAMGQQGHVMEAIAAGAKGFLVKPFDEEKLLKAIEKF